jgi:hypothetical protein
VHSRRRPARFVVDSSIAVGGDEAITIGKALEGLVHQFADPWSFLRELVQNAIDAGSPEVWVDIEHQPAATGRDGPGLMLVEVGDAGEGMDRQIIDTKLTRLFSSAKEGDFTKIGRFGIGFVSVFAIEPDLVCVDTGRTGEYWRVLFHPDRTFERIVLDHPVEGTTIRIYKQADAATVQAARGRAAEVLEYWCKHARVDIRLDGRPMSRPMALHAHCVVEHEEQGARVLLGLVPERAALRGYYHGGLTLHEEHDDRLPHVAFKIDSRYLEHTLTRDNVIRDENYEKAMSIVARLATTRLVDAVFDELEAGASLPQDMPELEFLRARAAEWIADGIVSRPLLDRPIVPTVGGPPVSLARCRAAAGRGLWMASERSPVTDALESGGALVIRTAAETTLVDLVSSHTQTHLEPVENLCTALPSTESRERARWQPLRAALIELLSTTGTRVSDIELGHLAYPGSPVAGWVAITQRKLGELTRIEDVGRLSGGFLSGRRVVVLNADHPTVTHALDLADHEPELAAYLVLRLFYLRSELDPERDGALATAAAEVRWQRSTS